MKLELEYRKLNCGEKGSNAVRLGWREVIWLASGPRHNSMLDITRPLAAV